MASRNIFNSFYRLKNGYKHSKSIYGVNFSSVFNQSHDRKLLKFYFQTIFDRIM